MSAGNRDVVSTSQAFTQFWIPAPGSPSAPIVGNPVANPVPVSDLSAMNSSSSVSAQGRGAVHQSNLTTMTNAVPHEEFAVFKEVTEPISLDEATVRLSNSQHSALDEPTHITVVDANGSILSHHESSLHMHHAPSHSEPLQQHQTHIHPHHSQQQTHLPQIHQLQQQQQQQQQQRQSMSLHQSQQSDQDSQGQPQQMELKFYPVSKTEITGEAVMGELVSCEQVMEVHAVTDTVNSSADGIAGVSSQSSSKKRPSTKNTMGVKVAQRRRLTASHREMIIDLVFNEKKTSREVARFMGLPQSTVMSVVQVFKKEHRIHKKTATGRKRRLTTEQEFQLYEMSQEHDNITVDEIRTRFLQKYPHFGHISKTTIYRTLERGKKGLIGQENIPDRYILPDLPNETKKIIRKTDSTASSNNRSVGGSWSASVAVESVRDMSTPDTNRILLTGTPGGEVSISDDMLNGGGGVGMEEGVLDSVGEEMDASVRHRRSLSIAEREMIISLFFNGNRTIREVADFMHLAKSTVSSVVQVFRKERRIQRKTSTGRRKKLSSEHEQKIMDILAEKEDITIEETRSKFLMQNPEVQNISKSTIYRIMENCQNKLKARSDLEVFAGTLVHATSSTPMSVLKDMVIGVLNDKIEFIESMDELDQLKAEYGFSDGSIYYMSNNQFLMPGLVDTHTHASQFPNNGLAQDIPLLEWLQTYTFPTEANFSDQNYARDVYTKVVDRLLRNGTTTAAYYATIHLPATKLLADIIRNSGQRAVVGKVNMIRNCPDYYKESSLTASIAETEEFIRYVQDFPNHLVSASVTPRFAPNCPEDQMTALAELAGKYSCHVQTHMAECQPENSWVRDLFPWAKNYAEMLDSMRLLAEKTIIAHAIWLTPGERALLAERRSGVAHCPASNLFLRSGNCDVRALLNAGVTVGLGTDCSGGSSSSILDALRRAVQVSNSIAIDSIAAQLDYTPISYKEAFRLATLGGAKVMNMDDKIGNFEVDKEFDALLIDVAVPNSPFDIFPQDTIDMKIDKFVMNGDDRNIVRVYVAGKRLIDNGSEQHNVKCAT